MPDDQTPDSEKIAVNVDRLTTVEDCERSRLLFQRILAAVRRQRELDEKRKDATAA